MRAVVQRVSRAKVTINDCASGQIAWGLLVLLGVGSEDTEADVDYLAQKIAGLRIFEDSEGKMNRSVVDVGGSVLAVSQFTLYGDVRRGKRPSFEGAAPPEQARRLYELFVERIQAAGLHSALLLEGALSALVHSSHNEDREKLFEAQRKQGLKAYLELRDGPFQPEPMGPRSKLRQGKA